MTDDIYPRVGLTTAASRLILPSSPVCSWGEIKLGFIVIDILQKAQGSKIVARNPRMD